MRVQRLNNIIIAKAFRTTSSGAFCVLVGMVPIIIRLQEAVKQYTLRQGKGDLTQLIDREVELKKRPHPADAAAIIEVREYEYQTIQICMGDGSKNEKGVGSGVAIFTEKELVRQLKYKLENICSNNQAEQIAIAKALEAIEAIDLVFKLSPCCENRRLSSFG
jgi:hypothetical protein